MTEYDAKGLLAAVAAELADIRAGVDEAGGLVSELLRLAPPEQRLTFLTRTQAFDVLSQRVDALSGLAAALPPISRWTPPWPPCLWPRWPTACARCRSG